MYFYLKFCGEFAINEKRTLRAWPLSKRSSNLAVRMYDLDVIFNGERGNIGVDSQCW